MSNPIFVLLAGTFKIRYQWANDQSKFVKEISESNGIIPENCRNYKNCLNNVLSQIIELGSNEETMEISSLYITSLKNELAALDIFIKANEIKGSLEASNLATQAIGILTSANDMARLADTIYQEKREAFMIEFNK